MANRLTHKTVALPARAGRGHNNNRLRFVTQ